MNEVLRKIAAIAVVTAVAVAVFFSLSAYKRAFAFTGSAECMVVLERDSGRILNAKNADVRRPMASTTKIATAITVIENVSDLDKKVKVPSAAAGVEGSSIYLSSGEELTIRDLLYGLMLQSGNDCAVALAITTGGSVQEFASMMNETAKKAGANDTNFVNPHGLHDNNHYTTASDLGKIAAYAMKNPIFREIVATKRYETPWAGREYNRVIVNKNKILSSYEGGDGIKTGYTKKAGRCLVASATRNGMNVIAVVLNCGPMFEDCRALLDDAFNKYELRDTAKILPNLACAVTEGKADSAALSTAEKLLYPLSTDEYAALKYEIDGVKTLRAPVNIGQENGNFRIYLDNRLLFERKLFTIEGVDSLSVTDRLRDIVERWND